MASSRLFTATKTATTVAARLSRQAYVTFLAGDGDYIKGVIGLAKGLRKAKAAYPLVVAVLPDVPVEHRRMLAAQGCVVKEIEPVNLTGNSGPFARAYYVINYTKLRIWEFVEYDKMIYLDGDIQVFGNIDHLFDLPDGYFYAVADCQCVTQLGYKCPETLPWPTELGPEPSIYFNAGMFVFEPSLSVLEKLFDTLKVTPLTAFAEQDFLNMFFKDIFNPISFVYNLLPTMLWRHPESVDLSKVRVVHYCAPGSKPWRYTGMEENMDREDMKMLVKKWWDIYNDESLDYRVANVVSTVDLGTATDTLAVTVVRSDSNAGAAAAIHYLTAPSAA